MRRSAARTGKIIAAAGLLIYIAVIIYLFRPQRLSFKEHRQEVPLAVEEQVIQFTQGFHYRDTEEGKVLFSLSARKVVGFARNTYKLEDVSLKFFTEDGALDVSCRTVDFDANTRDLGIQGSIMLTSEMGMTMWTDEMAYRHRTRYLMGLENVHFAFLDGYIGVMNRPVMDVRKNVITVDDGVEIFGILGDAFISDGFIVNLKNRTFIFPDGALAYYGGTLSTFTELEVREVNREMVFLGKCAKMSVSDPEGDIYLTAPAIRARFQKKGDYRPIGINLIDGGEMVRRDENMVAGNLFLRFSDGKFKSFTVDRNFTFYHEGSELSGITGKGRMSDAGEIEDFTAFGNVRLCTRNSIVRSEYLTAKILKDEFTFKNQASLLNGAVFMEGDSIVYRRNSDEVQVHGGVKVKDEERDLHVHSDHAIIKVESRYSTFTGSVHAWTPEYDLRCGILYSKTDWIEARESVTLVNYVGGQETLNADRIELDQVRNRLLGEGSVVIMGESYEAAAESILALQEKGVWKEMTLTGLVRLNDSKQGIEAESDRIDFLRNGGEAIFLEGCPATIKDKEGRIVTSSTIILDRTWGQMFLLGEKEYSRLEVKGETKPQT